MLLGTEFIEPTSVHLSLWVKTVIGTSFISFFGLMFLWMMEDLDQ